MLSPTWSVLLSVVFGLTGAYSLVRFARRASRPNHRPVRPAGDHVVDVNHVIMSVAMVVMVWWPAGPVGTAVQTAVFAAFAALFGLGVFTQTMGTVHLGRLGAAAHAAMNLAMVWMLAAMPLLMRGMAGSGTTAMPGMDMGAPAAGTGTGRTLDWAQGISWAAVSLMAVVAIWWLVHAIRADRERSHLCCHAAMGAGMAAMLAAMT